MSDLQFERAEFEAAKAQTCDACKRTFSGEYYSINGHVICGECRDHLGSIRTPATVLHLLTSLALGGLAAVIGAGLWGYITYRSSGQYGIVAVVVGLGVGYAVARGSERMGGALFQGIAVGLTYLAIAGSALVPSIIRAWPLNPDIHWFGVALEALALPLQAGLSLTSLIYLFALYEAWKVNKRPVIRIMGPFAPHRPPEATASG